MINAGYVLLQSTTADFDARTNTLRLYSRTSQYRHPTYTIVSAEMGKKVLAVFGATGLQGGSVIDYVLSNAELSSEYSIRAVTRDITKPSSQALRNQGVEVVPGDADAPDTLSAALSKADTVFIVTLTVYDDLLKEREFRQTKAIADAAVNAGAKYLIYSTMVQAQRLYGQEVVAFDSKAEGELYIRSLPIDVAFFAPGMFMQNFLDPRELRQVPDQPGVYCITNFIPGDTAVPFIDARADTGKFVGAILARPSRYVGQMFCAATHMYTLSEVAGIITRVTGKKTIYIQKSEKEWAESVAQEVAGPRVAMYKFIQDPGYYGECSKEKVAWTSEQVGGGLTSFEEFLERNDVFAAH